MVADKIYAMVEFHSKIIAPDCNTIDHVLISYSYKFPKLIEEEKI
jgi:hypothetical protein